MFVCVVCIFSFQYWTDFGRSSVKGICYFYFSFFFLFFICGILFFVFFFLVGRVVRLLNFLTWPYYTVFKMHISIIEYFDFPDKRLIISTKVVFWFGIKFVLVITLTVHKLCVCVFDFFFSCDFASLSHRNWFFFSWARKTKFMIPYIRFRKLFSLLLADFGIFSSSYLSH